VIDRTIRRRCVLATATESVGDRNDGLGVAEARDEPAIHDRLIWKILHQGVRYEERGPAVSEEAKKVRARKMIRELRSLGYRVELLHDVERQCARIVRNTSTNFGQPDRRGNTSASLPTCPSP